LLVWKNEAQRRAAALPLAVIRVFAVVRVVGALTTGGASLIAGMCESGRCTDGHYSWALALAGLLGPFEAVITWARAGRLRRTILDSAELSPELLDRRPRYETGAFLDGFVLVLALVLLFQEPRAIPYNIYWAALGIFITISAFLNRRYLWWMLR
jgi:hypothetical protein